MQKLLSMEQNEAELLKRWIQRKDREAADELIRIHAQSLFAFSMRLCRSENEASEIVQESFLRMLQSAERFAGNSSFRTWLFGIAINVHRNRRSKFLRLKDLFRPLGGMEESMSKQDSDRESKLRNLSKVDEAIASLPQSSRVPLLLHYYEGFSYEEMSDVMGCSQGTVASRLNTARKRLEKKLRRSGLEMSALVGIPVTAKLAAPRLPDSLLKNLSRIPEQAILPTALAPVGLSFAKWVAGIFAAVGLSAGTFFWMESSHAVKSNFPDRPAPRREVDSARSNPTRGSARVEPNSCEEMEFSSARGGRSSMVLNRIAPSSSANSNLHSLHVRGFVQDAISLYPESCRSLALKRVWPAPLLTENPRLVETLTNENGYYEITADGLESGIYELDFVADSSSAEQSPPLVIDLRNTVDEFHNFDLQRYANVEDRSEHWQGYREELSRSLRAHWAESGESWIESRVSATRLEEIQAFLFSMNKESIGPAVQVLEPIRGELILGPVSEGIVRLELLSPGVAAHVIAELNIAHPGAVSTSVSLEDPAESSEGISCEIISQEGKPVLGATVELIPNALWSRQAFRKELTDAHGRHCFDSLPRALGPWTLRVTPPAEHSSYFAKPTILCDVNPSAEPLRVVLE